MIDGWIRWLVAYLEWGFDIIFERLMTIEGIAALLFGLFMLGLISRLRS